MVVIVGGLLGWSLLAQREVSFEEAVKKPQLRDSYIEKIVKEIGKPDYITVVNYADTQEELEFLRKKHGYIPNPDDLMSAKSKNIQVDRLGKQPWLVRTSILPYAFSGKILKTEEDFISSLLHEYRHAEVIQEGKIGQVEMFPSFLTLTGEWNENLVLDIMELDAIRIELSTQGISKEYRANRTGRYLDHYINIWDHSGRMEPEFIERLKIEFFQSWIATTPFLFKEMRNGKEVWYLKHPETGRQYYLPEEIIARFKSGKG